jgi:hypothetical protein
VVAYNIFMPDTVKILYRSTYAGNSLKKRNCVCMPFLTYKNSDVKIKKSISIEPTQISGINARPRNQAYKNTSSFIIFPRAQLLVSCSRKGHG